MDRINIIFRLSFLLLGFSCQNEVKKQTLPSASFNGIWADSNNENFKNCYVIYSEVGDSIHVGHYLEFKDQPFFETGTGIIKGDSIIYHVDVIRPVPSWGPDGGTHYLKLSEDRTTLEGIFITDNGNNGPLVFKRR